MIEKKELLEKVCKENKEFKKLLNNHSNLKEKIQEYDKRKFLTSQEELEIKKLKKVKLKEKELMVCMLNEYQAKQA